MSTQTVIDRPDSNEQIDAQQLNEQPKEDLGYLRRKELISGFLQYARDETRSSFQRLDDISRVLVCAKSYENRFAEEIAEVTAIRDKIKRLLHAL